MTHVQRALRTGVMLLVFLTLLPAAPAQAQAPAGPAIVPTKKCWSYLNGTYTAEIKASIKRVPAPAGKSIESWAVAMRQDPTDEWIVFAAQGNLNDDSKELNFGTNITAHVTEDPPPVGTGKPISFELRASDQDGRETKVDPVAPPCMGEGVPALGSVGMALLVLLIAAGFATTANGGFRRPRPSC